MILAMGFLGLMERMKARIMKRGHGSVEGRKELRGGGNVTKRAWVEHMESDVAGLRIVIVL